MASAWLGRGWDVAQTRPEVQKITQKTPGDLHQPNKNLRPNPPNSDNTLPHMIL